MRLDAHRVQHEYQERERAPEHTIRELSDWVAALSRASPQREDQVHSCLLRRCECPKAGFQEGFFEDEMAGPHTQPHAVCKRSRSSYAELSSDHGWFWEILGRVGPGVVTPDAPHQDHLDVYSDLHIETLLRQNRVGNDGCSTKSFSHDALHSHKVKTHKDTWRLLETEF